MFIWVLFYAVAWLADSLHTLRLLSRIVCILSVRFCCVFFFLLFSVVCVFFLFYVIKCVNKILPSPSTPSLSASSLLDIRNGNISMVRSVYQTQEAHRRRDEAMHIIQPLVLQLKNKHIIMYITYDIRYKQRRDRD